MGFDTALSSLDHMISGVPTLALLLGVGIYLTLRFRFIQVRAYWPALKALCSPMRLGQDEEEGEISAFQALSTVLSGTIGTGNVAGVATAITMGGPGSVFWMWLTALLGMSIKFVSCTLAHHFRQTSEDGSISGGPVYTIKHGLKMPKLSAFLAICVIFGTFTTGGLVQTNSVVDGLTYIYPKASEHGFLIGVVMATLVGMVILGGVKRIGRVAAFLVPVMAVLYCLAALVILFLHAHQVPAAFHTIIVGAFHPAAVGGGMLGSVIQFGVARGLFSSEAGLGTAPIGLSVMRTKQPVKVGLIGMIGPSVDTVVLCTMTALVIVIMGAWGDTHPAGLEGASLSAYAFGHGLLPLGHGFSNAGQLVVGIGLCFFTYTTMIAWSYYGERNVDFLWGSKYITHYRVVFLILLVVGAFSPLRIVWYLSDIFNIFMCLPNLLSLVCLAGLAKSLSEDYLNEKPEGEAAEVQTTVGSA